MTQGIVDPLTVCSGKPILVTFLLVSAYCAIALLMARRLNRVRIRSLD